MTILRYFFIKLYSEIALARKKYAFDIFRVLCSHKRQAFAKKNGRMAAVLQGRVSVGSEGKMLVGQFHQWLGARLDADFECLDFR